MLHSNDSAKNSDQRPTQDAYAFRVEPSKVAMFISKLFDMVNDTRIQELIGWSSGGNRFCVYDTRQFAKTVLPQYFRHNNWTSFVRQLNIYGFHKLSNQHNPGRGHQVYEFHHPLFNQYGRQNIRKIRRNSKRGSFSSNMDLDLQPPQQDRHLLQTPRPQTSRYAAFETPQPDLELPPQASSSSISHPRKCMPISSLLSSHTQVYDNHRALHYSDSSTNGSSSEENDNASDISSDSDIGSNHGISASSRYNMHMISNQGGGHQSGVDHLALPNGTICSSLGPEINELQSRAVNPESELVDLKRYMARQYNHMLYMVDRLSSVNKFHSGKVSQTQPISNKSSQGTTQDPMLPDGDDSHDPSNDNQPNQISHHRYHQQHHHHHHHHHHYHHHSCRRQNSNDNDPGYDQSSDKNSIAIIEARTEDELYSNGNYNTYKPQQATETAKKDHHMHIHNFGNGGTTLASSSGTNTSSDKLGNRQNEVNFSFDTAKHNMNQKPPQGMATSPHRQEQGMTTPSPHQQD